MASTESHIGRNTKIGVSVGLIALFLLSLVATVLLVKKKTWRLPQDKERGRETMELWQHSIQEIANNSLVGPYRELPDSGKAELVDPTAPVAHELMNHRPSDGKITLHYHAPRSKCTTIVSTNMLTQNWTSIDTSSDMQCAKVQKLEMTNLNRSLPPTPISESPQVGPIAVIFNGVLASEQGPDISDERSAAEDFPCASTMRRVPSPTHLNAWQRRFAHLSHASMDMEIVIPPGLSEVEIIKPLKITKKTEVSRSNVF